MLTSILDLGLTENDFEDEKNQDDATLAHAIERLFVSFADSSSLKSTAYCVNDFDALSSHAKENFLKQLIASKNIIRPIIIFDHDFGGGTNIYSKNLVEKNVADDNQVIIIKFKNNWWFAEWICKNDGLTFSETNFNNLIKIKNMISIRGWTY